MSIFLWTVVVSLVSSLWPQAQPPVSPPRRSWADDRIIDVHGHIGTFRGYDLSTATLLANIERYGIRLVLVSNIDGAELPGTTQNLDEVKANLATIETVRLHPDRLRGLAWTRPEDGSPAKVEPFLREKIGPQRNELLFVGLKIHPEMNNFAADDARVDGYLQLCEKFRIPAVFHSGKRGSTSAPEKIYTVARRHPKVPIILYHMGFGHDHANAVDVAKEALSRHDAQLYLETAQAEPDAVLSAIKQLGSDRVLFGTDATYYGLDHYSHYEGLITRLKSELSASDYANVVRGNAERLFKLK